jgi:predicted XRE-type DNA-binding protein
MAIPARRRNQRRQTLDQFERRQAESQGQTAERLGIGQSRVADLMRNKYDKFGLDLLVTLATQAGRRVELALA